MELVTGLIGALAGYFAAMFQHRLSQSSESVAKLRDFQNLVRERGDQVFNATRYDAFLTDEQEREIGSAALLFTQSLHGDARSAQIVKDAQNALLDFQASCSNALSGNLDPDEVVETQDEKARSRARLNTSLEAIDRLAITLQANQKRPRFLRRA